MVFMPMAKFPPLATPALNALDTPGQLSAAVGAVYAAVATHVALAVTVWFEGQFKVGAWLSTTVTLKLQVAVLPSTLVAVTVTVVVPIG